MCESLVQLSTMALLQYSKFIVDLPALKARCLDVYVPSKEITEVNHKVQSVQEVWLVEVTLDSTSTVMLAG